eukprot:1030869-Heterocapsa_arctica.AAC.1
MSCAPRPICSPPLYFIASHTKEDAGELKRCVFGPTSFGPTAQNAAWLCDRHEFTMFKVGSPLFVHSLA